MARESWGALARLLSVAAVVALGVAPARAERSLSIESFDARVVVNLAGVTDVTETIQVRFNGSWNGLYRTIPVEYQTPQGFNDSLRLWIVSVTGEGGVALRYQTSRERHNLKVKAWVPGAVDVVKTIVIRYQVANALRFFEEHDELYWNVTGDEWDMPIARATATIDLPAEVENVRATSFTGGYGSRENAAQVQVAGPEVRVHTVQGLAFREGLTVAVAWNPGVVHRPTTAEVTAGFVRSNVLLLVPLVVFAGMWRLWAARGRDPRRRPIVVRYDPPDDLGPGEIGTLVDDSADLRDVTATLVDLAVRGFIRIDEHEDSWLFGLFTHKDYNLVSLHPIADWTPLLSYERKVLEGVFEGSGVKVTHEDAPGRHPVVKLSDLQNKFYKTLPGIRSGMLDRLVANGVYVKRPDGVRARYMGLGVVVGAGVLMGGLMLSTRLGLSPAAAIVAGVASAIIGVAFGYHMPARTEKGARTREAAMGFEEFLRRVESDRFERVIKTPEMFEKFLPYAMALGVEKHWAKAFDGICKEPPSWYHGSRASAFSTGMFVGHLGQMSASAGSAMASSPRSSGGSGFSGGSSGGGSGGGGGGGF
jgi:uncharacterized membrane protein YgcG